MEQITQQNFATTDEAWHADRMEASKCLDCDVRALVQRVQDRWKSASVGYRAMAYGRLDRATNRSLARSLRAAEQALLAVVLRAIPLFADGNGPFALFTALMRCRMLIVLPIARRMAAHDPEKRLVDDIAQFIVEKAQFIDGRAVIDQALASELPSPYADEAVQF